MREAGMTLPELLVGLLIMVAILAIVGFMAVPLIAAESARAAIHDAGMLLQRTKAEALGLNRNCRFVVDTGQRSMSVWDGNGTSGTSVDDILLVQQTLPPSVGFARPDAGAVVTFTNVAGSIYEVVFDSSGRVDSGVGEMVLFGGGRYRRATVYGAGGVRVERWEGSAWIREY